MNDDRRELEQTVRAALRDAAEHAPLASGVPLTDIPDRQSLRGPRHGRVRYLVAAVAVVIVVVAVGAAVVVAGDGGGGNVRVAAPGGDPREVSPDQLPASDADVIVYLHVGATDEQIAGVRAALDSSPDVTQYAFVDQAAAMKDFADRWSCAPDLVDSVLAKDLPVSFRVVTVGDGGQSRVLTALGGLPGVEALSGGEVVGPSSDGTGTELGAVRPSITDESRCLDQGRADEALPVPPQPTPAPTLPPAGDPPADPTGSRDAVVAAFTQAWNGTLTVDERRAAMQDADGLAAELDRARAGNESSIATMYATIDDVTFVAPNRAAVAYHINIGSMPYPSQIGYAVFEGDEWKVGRETVCQVLSIASVNCPAG